MIQPLLQAAAFTKDYTGAWAPGLALIGAGLATIGAGIGIGGVGGKADEAKARQPEIAGKHQTAGIIFAALVEANDLLTAVTAFLIQSNFYSGLPVFAPCVTPAVTSSGTPQCVFHRS